MGSLLEKKSEPPPLSSGSPMAPPVGLEPTTPRLTAACSTIELRRNISGPNSVELRPVLALPIFPGRRQPSIVGRNELNYRVRNGNGWTLILINTNYLILKKEFGDPYRIRTDVNGVRGRCLNHLTNGPYWYTLRDSNPGHPD